MYCMDVRSGEVRGTAIFWPHPSRPPPDFQTLRHPCSLKNFKIQICSSTWLTVCRYFLDNKLDVEYTYSVIANALTQEVFITNSYKL